MSALMNDLEFIRIYVDDLLIFTRVSFKENSSKAKEVMKRPPSSVLKWNINKCKLSVPKVEYLGYIITW